MRFQTRGSGANQSEQGAMPLLVTGSWGDTRGVDETHRKPFGRAEGAGANRTLSGQRLPSFPQHPYRSLQYDYIHVDRGLLPSRQVRSVWTYAVGASNIGCRERIVLLDGGAGKSKTMLIFVGEVWFFYKII